MGLGWAPSPGSIRASSGSEAQSWGRGFLLESLLSHSGHVAGCPLGGRGDPEGSVESSVTSRPGKAPSGSPALVQLEPPKASGASRADPGGPCSLPSFLPVGHRPQSGSSHHGGGLGPFAGKAPLLVPGKGSRTKAFARVALPQGILSTPSLLSGPKEPPAACLALCRGRQGESPPTASCPALPCPMGLPKGQRGCPVSAAAQTAQPGPNPQNQPSGPRESGRREHVRLLPRLSHFERVRISGGGVDPVGRWWLLLGWALPSPAGSK